ncbi:flagellar type III secretion system pore protein FliP [Tissierella praeacuta]|uniref:Flagellar biosynthetic protein FliP n=1 Tax=Tissierella praeacuta DSM 18095 TaxID=1123404 RepID=A0A1M4SKW0_9FIRM|nr:flagellar type III secretion system pore protein FliP [Tissierella praeacuta]MBU5254768.1 flagellar type III secretion system pore protein FliP [Tissierella praeacuta]SHE32840.1 flagellar biosynthetic protein FliP [Tissierella praeacuta DSM 18095]SUP01528.1 Flagellar biosynthetic protein fliP precursor [Tissierella praeacuta]
MRKNIKTIISAMILVIIFANVAFAEPSVSLFGKSITLENNNNPENYVFSIQLLFILTILTLAPSLLIMMTGFTRILIVLSFIRNALGLQQTPPNHVIIGLALFLTFFVMAPIATEINNEAIQPYIREEINQDIAINNAMNPIRNFMFKQTRDKDLGLFLSMKGTANISNISEIPTHVLVPAFIISELKTAFQIGFIIYIPFLVIDMVVSSTLMAMGMMMLPPVIISLPFKILLFVLVDGWNLIVKSLVLGFK